MTRRLDQLPHEPSNLARDIAKLRSDLDELRARPLDLSAADALLPPLDVDSTRWPQTVSATYATIATSSNIAWGSQLRLALTTSVGAGTTGNIRVTINGVQWGPTVAGGGTFDYTGPHGVVIGAQYQISIEAQRTGGANTVAAQVRLIRSIA